jgi:hypothetical protein
VFGQTSKVSVIDCNYLLLKQNISNVSIIELMYEREYWWELKQILKFTIHNKH